VNFAQEQAAQRARGTLVHYVSTLFEAAGLKWEGDNRREVEGVVDDLITAAAPEAVAVPPSDQGQVYVSRDPDGSLWLVVPNATVRLEEHGPIVQRALEAAAHDRPKP
jgi:hypothetical protein